MFAFKFWFAVCFIFLFYSIADLFEKARSVKYLSGVKGRQSKEIANFSFCVEINESALEPFRYSLENEITYRFTVEQLLNSSCPLYFRNRQVCLDSISLNRSYLFNHHLCFNFKMDQFDALVRNATVGVYRVFFYFLDQSEIFFYYNHINFETAKPFELIFTVSEIQLLGAGYQSDCEEYSNKNVGLKTSETIFSQSSCLYECLKSKASRSLSYYYSTKDTKYLTVNRADLERSRKIHWKISDRHLTRRVEKKCQKVCKKPSCIISKVRIEQSLDSQKKFGLRIGHIFSASKPFISNFTLAFDFLSLVALFFNISVLGIVPVLAFRLIKKSFYLYLKFYKRYLPVSYLRKSYWALKICSFTLCWSLLIFFSLCRAVKFAERKYDILMSTSFPSEILPFYWVVCVPVQMFLNQSTDLDPKLETDLLANSSFAELEALTNFDKFRNGIKKIYVVYAATSEEVKYSINENKVLFRNFDYKLSNRIDSNFLTRCYEIHFEIQELDKRRYEMLFSLSDLRLRLNFDWYLVCPLSINRQMSARSEVMFSKRHFKRTTFQKASNCLRYEVLYRHCGSRRSCVEWCVLEKFREKHFNLTTQAVVERSQISQTDLRKIYFNRTLDKKIFTECQAQFVAENCYAEFFEIEKSRPVNRRNRTFSMYLYYPENIHSEDPHLTLTDLLLNNLLNFWSIFIGLNVGKLFALLFALLKRWKLFKYRKFCRGLAFLVCLFGFLFHGCILWNNALNGDLVFVQEFSKFETVQMPNLIFCFKFNENEIDPNRKLTAAYLAELTNDLNLGFFRDFHFLDANYEWVRYNQITKNETVKKLEEISWFYFKDLKCFEFKFLPIPNDRYLYLLKDARFVRVTFDKKAIANYYNSSAGFRFWFINRKKNTHELNGIDKIEFKKSKNGSRQLFSIHSNLVVFRQEDIFGWLKQPSSWLFRAVNLNDTSKYITELNRDFGKYNLKTKMIPMPPNDESLEIDVSA